MAEQETPSGIDSSATVHYLEGMKGGPRPPGGNELEARVAKLETDIEYVKRDVGELRGDMKDVRERVIKIEERMATKAFVFSVYGIVSAMLAAIMLFQGQLQTLLGLASGSP